MIDGYPNPKSTKIGKIGNRILGGFFLMLPIALTVWIAGFLYNVLTDWVEWILEIPFFEHLKDVLGFETLIRLLSLILILCILFAIGSIAKYAVAKRILTILERGILKIPMLNIVYSTTQQIIDALRNPSAGMFRKVILFEYPRKGLYVIGFLTNENESGGELEEKTGKDLISIFLPTTPNPTSGFLLLVPREDCIFLEMGIKEGMRMVISGGAISPNTHKKTKDHNDIVMTKT